MKLDAKNVLCPMPVIRTQEKVATMANGEILTVYCTDPGALYDIPAWCRVHGHELVATKQEGREIAITIQVQASHY